MTNRAAIQSIPEIPLAFVPNQGQADPRIQFHAHGLGGTVSFLNDGLVLALPIPDEKNQVVNSDSGPDPARKLSSTRQHRLAHVHFEGADQAVELVANNPLSGVVNYLHGNDPARWQTQLTTYAEIQYQQLYPGVDLSYNGTRKSLKGTYIVAPGANPSQIRWYYEDSEQVSIDSETGDLHITLRAIDGQIVGTTLVEQAPTAWQDIDGERLVVAARFILDAQQHIGFKLEKYDTDHPLILDPQLLYSTYLGGSGDDWGDRIAIDSSLNIYVSGHTSSMNNFPVTLGAYQYTFSVGGSNDSFVTKINSSGVLVFSTFLGGRGDEYAQGLAVDKSHNVYIAGWTNSSNFPTTPSNAYQTTYSGNGWDVFLTVLDPTGSNLLYSTFLGGNDDDGAFSIAVDDPSNVYLGGFTKSTNLPIPPMTSPFQGGIGAVGTYDGFVAKFDTVAGSLKYLSYLGAQGIVGFNGAVIVSNGAGWVYAAANTNATYSYHYFGVNSNLPSGYNVLVAKIDTVNSSPSNLAVVLSGSGDDNAIHRIALDRKNNVYIAGQTSSSDFPTTPGAYQRTLRGAINAYVSKLSFDLSKLIYSTYLGGTGTDSATSVAVGLGGNAYVVGYTTSSDFPLANPIQGVRNGSQDGFVTQLSPDGSKLYFSDYFGGNAAINAQGIENVAVDLFGDIYITGYTNASSNFPITANALQPTLGGSSDAFVAKLFGTVGEPSNTGAGFCLLCWIGELRSGLPIGLHYGEKMEEVTDLSVPSISDTLSFTRSYRQSKQNLYQFMGLGWTHNQMATLIPLTTTAEQQTLLLQMPNGGEVYFTQSVTDATLYLADPGSAATVRLSSNQYILTALDQSTYTFYATGSLVGQLASRQWPTGDQWTYSYTGTQLTSVLDNYGRGLQFSYKAPHMPAQFDDGQLWRVGDQTAAGLSGVAPTGRYVEFGYIPERLNGAIVSTPHALLARIRDVRGNTWTYNYYGQTPGETDPSQQNYLVGQFSPQMDLTGAGGSGSPVLLKNLAYTLSGSNVSNIVQQNGLYGTELLTDGDLESTSGQTWPSIGGATLTANSPSAAQVHTGPLSRYVAVNAVGQGIESNPVNLVANRLYVMTAWVYANPGATVTFQLSTDATTARSSVSNGGWELLQMIYKPAANVGGAKLQFVASHSTDSFYVDSVSLAEFDLSQAGVTAKSGSLGTATSWAFQPAGQNITTETTAGKTTTHVFNGGVYAGPQDPAGNASSQSLNNQYRPATQTDARGNQTQLSWSSDGRQLNQVVDAMGNQTRFTYNSLPGQPGDGTLNTSLDAQGRKTQYMYADSNNPRLPTDVKVFDTNGVTLLQWQQFTYSTGRTIKELTLDPKDATGLTIQYEIDRAYYASGNGAASGLLQSVTQKDLLNPANTTTTTYLYDAVGRLVRSNQSATFGNCLSSYTVYDAAGNVVASLCNYDSNGQSDPTTAAGAVAIYQTAFPSDPTKNRVTTHVYDTLGRRVQSTTDAGAPYTQFSLSVYDGLNRVVRTISNYVPVLGITDPYTHPRANFTHGANNDQNLISETVYNERGFVRSQTDVLGSVMLHGYDDAGRLIRSVQNASQPNYDNSSLGSDPTLNRYANLITSNNPDQDQITNHQYDAAGNLIRSTDTLGNVALMGYDALNRPVRTLQNASQPNYNLSVDPDLRNYVVSGVADQDLLTYTEYDVLGRVTRTQDTLGSWTLYAYDALGRQTAAIRNASVPHYDASHDATFSNYPFSTAVDQDVLTQTVYDTFGRVLYTVDPLGNRTWPTYDGLGRVVKTVANAVGTATDNGPRDPRSPLYGASIAADKDLISLTTYDSNGYVMWTQDALGRRTWFAYDTVGRQIKTIANAVGTATDNGRNDPRSPLYAPSAAADQDLISQTVYDAQGRVSMTIDTLSSQTKYVYDSLGRRIQTIANFVTGVYNPLRPDQDLISTTVYDTAGRVAATVDARGTRTTFSYDRAGRRLTVTQAAGTPLATTSYTCYDKSGRVLRTIQNWRPAPTDPSPDARDAQGNWLFNPNTYGPANDRNLVTTFTVDRLGRQLTRMSPFSLVNSTGNSLRQLITTMTYYPDGQLESVTDSGGATTKYRYDGLRRRVLTVEGYTIGLWGDPAGWQWNVGAGQWQDAVGIAIGHTGGDNRPNSINLIAQVNYDRAGRVLSQRDPNGHLTTYGYDQLNRRTALTDPLNHTWQTSYVRLPNGQSTTTSIDANNASTLQTFDMVGRLKTLQYLGETTPKPTPDVTFGYDKGGNRLSMTENNGVTNVRGTTFSYDQAHRLSAARFDVNGDGSSVQTVSYQYEPGGLRTALVLPGGQTVNYAYNARGQLIQLTDWNSQAARYDYDNAGRLSAIERANGLRSAYQYDASSRLTQLRHTAGSRTLGHFSYWPGPRGDRTQILEAIPKFGSGNTLLTSTDPSIAYSTKNTWTAANGFKGSTDFSASLHVAFFGSQATLQLGQGPNHGICDIYIDDALWQSFDGYTLTATDTPYTLPLIQLTNDGPHTLDIRNRDEKNKLSTGFKLRFYSLSMPVAYDLHTVSCLRLASSTPGGYDAASRLWFADYYPGDNLTATPYLQYDYTYDLAGNRTQQKVTVPLNSPPIVVSSFAFNAANQLASLSVQNEDILGTPIGGPTVTNYGYNNNGNLTTVNLNTTAYTWDRANRLLTNGGASYAYNGLGQRVQQIYGGQTTQYLLDTQPGLWKVLQATTSGATTSYVHGPMGIQAQNTAGAWTYPIQDGLGSVRGVVNATNVPQESRFYDPYGTVTQTSGSPQTVFGFTGEETDVNGLLNLRARYYNPAIGQFISLDPLETSNRFAYTNGNPINWTDPSGFYFNCSNEGNLGAACADLNVALSRSEQAHLTLASITGGPLGSDRSDKLSDKSTYQSFKQNAENLFGVQFSLYVGQDKEPNSNCNDILANNSAKYSLVQSVAAMVHIVSRFKEMGFSDPIGLFRTNLGVRYQFNDVGQPDAAGYTPKESPNQVFLGYNNSYVRATNSYTNAYFATSTIVHELGHAFDRSFQYRPGIPLKLLQIRRNGAPDYDPDSDTTNILSAFDNANAGVLTRAAAYNLDDPKEMWADMFMTWVFNDYNVSGSGSPINSWRGERIGWKPNPVGSFSRTYTEFAIKCLMTGDCGTIQFPASGNPIKGHKLGNSPEDPFVKLMVGVSHIMDAS